MLDIQAITRYKNIVEYRKNYLILFFLLSCSPKEKEPTAPAEAEQVIKKFELTEIVEGVTNFCLEADKALLYQDKTVVYKVRLNFYSKGAPYAVLTSDSGILLTATNDMEAMGNVVVISTEETKLETHALKWVNTEGKIKTRDQVVITTKDNKKLVGTEFESDPGLTHIKLKEVHGYSD